MAQKYFLNLVHHRTHKRARCVKDCKDDQSKWQDLMLVALSTKKANLWSKQYRKFKEWKRNNSKQRRITCLKPAQSYVFTEHSNNLFCRVNKQAIK